MKIQYINGDLVLSSEKVIAHGCNAQGVMKSGIAKVIRDKYPEVFSDYYNKYQMQGHYLKLGDVIPTILRERTILNIISQKNYGRDSDVRYVSYDAICDAIERINRMNFDRVAFPKIGAGLANGNWNVISTIIESYSNFTPVVYYIDA